MLGKNAWLCDMVLLLCAARDRDWRFFLPPSSSVDLSPSSRAEGRDDGETLKKNPECCTCVAKQSPIMC